MIAYLRTIDPVASDPPASRLDFPVNLIVRFLPADADLAIRAPAPGTPAYGAYLVRAAGCGDCHTARDAGGNPVGEPFAGGQEFLLPGLFLARAANITPHPEAGIVAPGERNTVMPWWEFAGMRPEDLGAIYDYLRTVPASPNRVVTHEPPPE